MTDKTISQVTKQCEAVSTNNPHKGHEIVLGSDKNSLLSRLTLDENLSCNNCQEKTKILEGA